MELNTRQPVKRIRKPGCSATPNLDRLVNAVEAGCANLGEVLADKTFLNDLAAESKKTRMQQNLEQAKA